MRKLLSKIAHWLLISASWGILCAMVAGKALQVPIVTDVSMKVFDTYQRLAPRTYSEAGVRIIDIDDASLEKLGQWPWPRNTLAALNQTLHEAGAAVIAYDILFPEQDRTSPDMILPLWGVDNAADIAKNVPNPDHVFAQRLAHSNSVTALMLSNRSQNAHEYNKSSVIVRGTIPPHALPKFDGMIGSLKPLTDAAKGNGSINNIPDPDGIIRRVPLLLSYNGQLYPSLAIEALRVAMGLSSMVLQAQDGLEYLRMGPFTVPMDRNGMSWVYYTKFEKDRYIPAWKIMEGDFSKDSLEGHIVFIGTSAAGLKDLRATPFYADLAGVEVHAQAVEQILLNQFLLRPDWMFGAELLVVAFLGIITILFTSRTRSIISFACMVTLCGAAVALSWYAFRYEGILIEPVSNVITISLVYVMESVRRFLHTEQERAYIRDAFGLYLSPALVERAVANPDELTLGGENRELTVMFLDVRSFSGYSEKLNPRELTRFMNEFLTPMTDCVMHTQGTVDKYIGDCIMAFWNAPLKDEHHATHAIQSVLDMRRALKTFNIALKSLDIESNEPLPEVRIGIGLNTGLCCVGNMGSTMRFNYSAMGNAVDMAARLEGQSKLYGVDNVVGETTMQQSEGFSFLQLDYIQVKGKAQAVRIYTAIGTDKISEMEEAQQLFKSHDAMLTAYREQRWKEALLACEEAATHALALAGAWRAAQPDEMMLPLFTVLYDLYRERIDEYMQSPPPADWDGVYVARFK